MLKFDRDGFLVMENFISVEKCNALRSECDRIIESNHFAEEVSKISVFSAAGNDTEVVAVICDLAQTFYFSLSNRLLN